LVQNNRTSLKFRYRKLIQIPEDYKSSTPLC
jgi:hypothetical protein